MMLHNLSEPWVPRLFETSATALKYVLQWRDDQRARRVWREGFALPETCRKVSQRVWSQRKGRDGWGGIPQAEEGKDRPKSEA